MAENGLAEPISIPVMVAAGGSHGPIVGITAAMHGNELNGIPLIQRLFREINCADLCGTLVAVPVVNIPGTSYDFLTSKDSISKRESFQMVKISIELCQETPKITAAKF